MFFSLVDGCGELVDKILLVVLGRHLEAASNYAKSGILITVNCILQTWRKLRISIDHCGGCGYDLLILSESSS